MSLWLAGTVIKLLSHAEYLTGGNMHDNHKSSVTQSGCMTLLAPHMKLLGHLIAPLSLQNTVTLLRVLHNIYHHKHCCEHMYAWADAKQARRQPFRETQKAQTSVAEAVQCPRIAWICDLDSQHRDPDHPKI